MYLLNWVTKSRSLLRPINVQPVSTRETPPKDKRPVPWIPLTIRNSVIIKELDHHPNPRKIQHVPRDRGRGFNITVAAAPSIGTESGDEYAAVALP